MPDAASPSLSFRLLAVGGPIQSPPTHTPSGLLRDHARLVLLIHGYNVTQEDGRDAFRGFRNIQRELGGLPTDRQIVDLYWPGDADWRLAKALFYMQSIGVAKEVGKQLAAELKRAVMAYGQRSIEIVAHSLGCRLTLELLRETLDTPELRVTRVVLMAGAVPTFMLEQGGRLYDGYRKIEDCGVSLFSTDDEVLGYAFRAGQGLAPGDEGTFPTALGYEFWSHRATPGNLRQHQIFGADHSDYWGKYGRTPSQFEQAANTYVREYLGFGGLPAREVSSREVLERFLLPARMTPDRVRELAYDREVIAMQPDACRT